jgi:hypothetical protein
VLQVQEPVPVRAQALLQLRVLLPEQVLKREQVLRS